MVKDEFETSAEYEARRAHVQGSSNPYWLLDPHLAQSELSYDADNGRFDINTNSLAADLSAYDQSDVKALNSAGLDISEYNRSLNFGYAKNVKLRKKMTNAFGVEVEVEVVDADNFRVLDRPVSSILDKGVWQHEFIVEIEKEGYGGPYVSKDKIVTLEMAPDLARKTKPNIKGAVLLQPKIPYRVNSRPIASSFSPSIDFPYVWTDFYKVIVADIQCYAFLDENNAVLKTVEPNL